MDFMALVQSYLMTHQYDCLLKKANFKAGYTVEASLDTLAICQVLGFELKKQGETNESPSIRKENVPQLQDRASQPRGTCDLQ
jgi:hypothetical protein